MKTSSQPLFRSAAAVALSALVLAACSGGKEQQGGAPGAGAPPQAPAVTVMTVASGSVPMVTELPGRTTPYLIAELRPQVTGILTQRAFDEGSEVKAGQVLYRIDDAPYQAAHDSAKAALARAEANAQVARIKAERHAGLVKIDAVSKQANDDTQAALKQAQAEVAAAKAALDKARIDLDYTRLKSPISGRIGRSAVTPGALVTANQTQALATVQQLDPIYVDLTQS
ncbi:efflux RND transporter periplasmic adaptor subunit, partial [Thauera sp. UPWRP]